jgi:hypothetical protein
MQRTRFVASMIIVSSLTTASVGCKKGQKTPPAVQQTAGVQPRSDAVTVTGCLRSGAFAPDTWVLTSSAGSTRSAVATYQLVGGDPAALRDNAGREVEVSGTVTAAEQVASTSGPVEQHAAKGTSGTPAVQTQTEVNLKRLSVSSIKAAGGKCDD